MKTKTITLGLLLGFFAIAGCVSPEERAKREAAQQAENAKQQQAARERAAKFMEGWAKLEMGMTATQVSELLGGLPVHPGLIEAAGSSRVASIVNI